jgi:3-oxoacyl-[acyl-carrier-protein] synthase-3
MSSFVHAARAQSVATHSSTAVGTARLAGLGAALPQRRVSNEEIAALLPELTAEGIRTRTGVQNRCFAAQGEKTSDLAVEAASQALRQAGVRASDVNLIVLATATPDHLMPATACRVQHRLGATRAAAFDLSAACSGFVYALWVGQQFVQNRQADCVLVIGAETMSRIVDPADRSSILFGDGAGAAVLRASEGRYRLGHFTAQTRGEQYDYLLREGGSENPFSSEVLAAGGHFLRMEGRKVFRSAVECFSEAIQQTCRANGLALEEIDWIVPHQANARIFDEVAVRLGVPLNRFWLNLAKCGNTVAASVPLALAELDQECGPIPGSRILLACVGAGMCSGGTVLYVE